MTYSRFTDPENKPAVTTPITDPNVYISERSDDSGPTKQPRDKASLISDCVYNWCLRMLKYTQENGIRETKLCDFKHSASLGLAVEWMGITICPENSAQFDKGHLCMAQREETTAMIDGGQFVKKPR